LWKWASFTASTNLSYAAAIAAEAEAGRANIAVKIKRFLSIPKGNSVSRLSSKAKNSF
jgi:hypothetical protein